MKKTSKKIIGGFLVIMLMATVGVLIVSAQTDEADNNNTQQTNLWCKQQICGPKHFVYNLTDEQQNELNDLIKNLKEQGANSSEIRDAIQEKLDEWGILDKQLDDAILQAEQRLQILNRQKELRNEGYSWEEIRDIIQEEFNLQSPIGDGHGMMFQHGFHRGPCRGQFGFKPGEESD